MTTHEPSTHEPNTQEPTRAGGAGFVGIRLAARLARREVRRRPGRTLLVALLVATPVAGMIVADVLVRTNHQTPVEYWRTQYGQADAVARPGSYDTDGQPVATPPGDNRVAALLAKSRVIVGPTYTDARLLRTVDGHRSDASVLILPIADPMTHGIVQMMWGRAPKGGNEVFLTRSAAHDLHVGAGGTLRIARPVRHDFTVTGIGEFADGWERAGIVFPPGERIPWTSSPATGSLLVDLPPTVTARDLQQVLAKPEAVGWGLQVSPALVATPRSQDFAAADAERKVRWSWVVGALVLTVAGIVIAAAFAAGARRQLVTLGQLAANGAPPKLLRRVLFLQGTWTGVVGALAGIGLGAGALAALAP
jgi:putative ABC transport system permease protein